MSGEIVTALLTLIGMGITGFVTIMVALIKTFRQARAANDAVNSRGQKAGLLEMIVGLHEHKGCINAKVDGICSNVDQLIIDQVQHRQVHAEIQVEQQKTNTSISKLVGHCAKCEFNDGL